MRLFPRSGYGPGSPDSWIPFLALLLGPCMALTEQFPCVCPLLLSLWPWAYAPQCKGRAMSTPNPVPTPALTTGTFTGTGGWVLVASPCGDKHPAPVPQHLLCPTAAFGETLGVPEPPLRPQGTPCPSLSEAAGGLRWHQLYRVQGRLVHPSPCASVFLQGKKSFWQPCLALAVSLVPPAVFPAS